MPRLLGVLLAGCWWLVSLADVSEAGAKPNAMADEAGKHVESGTDEVPGRAGRARGGRQAPQQVALSAELLNAYGLVAAPECQVFTDTAALVERQQRWRKLVGHLAQQRPQELHDWIVGVVQPPKAAMAEAERQRDCLVEAMIEAAAASEPRMHLGLDLGALYTGQVRSVGHMAQLQRTHPQWRRRFAYSVTYSGYRNARAQAQIWRRKFLFDGRPFHVISAGAAETCGLTAGQNWRPQTSRHQRCWNEQLTREQREREILNATAAPGISRHHWGTEYDLLSLSAGSFLEAGPLGREYQWMVGHAQAHGYFQPYTQESSQREHAHIEERWHWSYFPVAQALWEYIRENPEAVESALVRQWDAFEAGWNGRRRPVTPYFGLVRERWRDYVFHIATGPAPAKVLAAPAPQAPLSPDAPLPDPAAPAPASSAPAPEAP